MSMNTEQFIDALDDNYNEAMQIIEKKNGDYADDEDPFQNFKFIERSGFLATEEGIAVRMTDKLQRILNLIQKDSREVEDERIDDTLLDLMNYANIMLVYLQHQRDMEESSEEELADGGQKECPYCDGEGIIYGDDGTFDVCENCEGFGWVQNK